MQRNSLKLSRRGTRLSLMPLLFAAMLQGCASHPALSQNSLVECPQSTPLPATVARSSSEDAKAYSLKAQSFSEEVRTWLLKAQSFLQE